jgi:CHAT domain-containing protein
MVRFYDNLWNKKLSKLEALREAQIWMLRHGAKVGAEIAKLRGVDDPASADRESRGVEDPEDPTTINSNSTFASPKYWAAWVLSGDWR